MKDILLDNQVDVAQLSFEAEQAKPWTLSFDPQVDITSDEWESIRKREADLRRFKINGAEVGAYMSQAADYSLLTGRKQDLSWLTPKRIKQVLYYKGKSKQDSEYRQTKVDENSTSSLARLLLVEPSFRASLEVDKNWMAFGKRFIRDTMNITTPLLVLEARVILGVDKLRTNMGDDFFDDDRFRHNVRGWDALKDVNKMLAELDQPAPTLTSFYNPVSWTGVLVAAKILKPDMEPEFNLTEQRWTALKRWLRGYARGNEWSKFLDLATNMYLLTAQKLELTPQGLKITMPEPLKEEAKDNPIPEQRSYR